MLGEDVLFLGATELGEKLRARAISPVELTESYLDRIARIGPRLNAFATVTADLARSQARQAEQEINAGNSRGPLHGVPCGVKDLLATGGIPTTWGAKPCEHQVFQEDATVVRKLREAGAVLLGKLAMVELAGGLGYHDARASLQGPGRNPWDPGRWTGGSSSGAGAAVSAGLVGFAIGSETWGSIVCPSSFCGVSGLRPTYGRVSRHGAMVISWTTDKLGPLARSARDCRTILSVLAGPDPADPTASAEPVDFATPPQPEASPPVVGYLQLDFRKMGQPEVDSAVRAAVDELRAAGVKVKEARMPEGPWEDVAVALISVEAVSSFEPLFRSGGVKELVDPRAAWQETLADEYRGRDYLRAQRLRGLLQSRLPEVFREFDVIAAPGFVYEAPRIEENLDKALAGPDVLGAVGNLCGLPAACIPCGFGPHKMPVAIQLVGRPYEESSVLHLAELYQSRTDWHRRRPPLS